MESFIARIIKVNADVSIIDGQTKYKEYFINTLRYVRYKDGVDSILRTEGYNGIIVNKDEEDVIWT